MNLETQTVYVPKDNHIFGCETDYTIHPLLSDKTSFVFAEKREGVIILTPVELDKIISDAKKDALFEYGTNLPFEKRIPKPVNKRSMKTAEGTNEKINFREVFRKYNPYITDHEINNFLWNETCFPFDHETTIKQIEDYYQNLIGRPNKIK